MLDRLACPCERKQRLAPDGGDLVCAGEGCGRRFPVVGGVPILIRDEASVLSVGDFLKGPPAAEAEGATVHPASLRGLYRRFTRFLVMYEPPLAFLREPDVIRRAVVANPAARILVVGCGDKRYEAPPGVTIVYTDVAFGPLAQYICDAHDLPFEDGSFDLVMAIAVLEHVVDPARCVAEFHRVLRPGGAVFSMIPFLQPVHMGRYDFTRFSQMGHRRLFRMFEVEETGLTHGPAASLSWALRYFLLSFTDNLAVRKYLRLLGYLVTFPLRFLDLLLYRKEGAMDSAGGTFLFGRRRETPVSDRDILAAYRGLDGV